MFRTTNQCLYPPVTLVLNEFSMPFLLCVQRWISHKKKKREYDKSAQTKKLCAEKTKFAYSVQLTVIPLKVLIAFVSTRAARSECGDLREGES